MIKEKNALIELFTGQLNIQENPPYSSLLCEFFFR